MLAMLVDGVCEMGRRGGRPRVPLTPPGVDKLAKGSCCRAAAYAACMADCCAADVEGREGGKSGGKGAAGFLKGAWPTPPLTARAAATKEGVIFDPKSKRP